MSSGKVLLGVLAGVAIGTTLGILFAPDKGSETRRKIAEKSKDYADGMKEKFNELSETVSKKFDKVKEDAMHMAQKGKSKTNEYAEEIRDTVS